MKKNNIFTIITKFIVTILPFYVILSLILEQNLKIPFAGFFFKEFLIILLFFSLIFEYFKDKKIPKFDILDYLIFIYIIYGIGITFFNGLGLKSLIFGGRYDFMFFMVMLIFKHSSNYLMIKTDKLLELFLISGGVSLFVGIVFKFALGEQYLVNFGFVDYVGNWIYSGGVPNFHGLEGTGIRRFQGILDGPNPMAYFLIIYSFLFLYSQKNKKEYYVFLAMIFFFWLIILTYSRSALLGIGVAILSLFLLDFTLLKKIKKIFLKHKKIFISIIIFLLIGFSAFVYTFRYTLENIFLRVGSTSGHFERMEVGFNRFLSKPLGSGLSEAGPAFRSIYKEKQTKEDEIYYIPESWYIQVLIEGGIIYFLIFVSILIIILKELFKKSLILFSMFIAILIMNFFLHIFEATYLSTLLFLFIGLFIKKD